LDGLIEKWKAAAQQAAEELYETSKSRVQKYVLTLSSRPEGILLFVRSNAHGVFSMGGLKEIAAMQRRNRAEFLEDLQSEPWNKRSAKDTEYELEHDEVSSPPGDTHPDEGSSQEEEKVRDMPFSGDVHVLLHAVTPLT
jgi:hypothetical protein